MSEAGIAISDISMELPEAKANPELLQRCKRICDDFRLSAADLNFEWDLLTLNSKSKRMTLEALSELEERVSAQASKRMKVEGGKGAKQQFGSRTQAATFNKDTAHLLGASAMGVTPTARRSSMLDGGMTPSTAQAPSPFAMDAAPSGQFAARQDAGKVVSTFNPKVGLPIMGGAAEGVPPVEVEVEGGAFEEELAPSRMWERMDERARLLDAQLARFEAAVDGADGFPPLASVVATGPDEVTVVGRVCCEGEGKLNMQSIFLEGSRATSGARRVRLDLTDCPEFALFPGQLVACVGVNAIGRTFAATKVVATVPAPQGAAPTPRVEQPTTLLAAAGPFTTTDDLTYAPLNELLRRAADAKPDALVLVGPFVDEAHPAVASGEVPVSFQELFERQVVVRLAEFIEGQMEAAEADPSCRVSHVVLIPSHRDAAHSPIYPQTALDVPAALVPEHVRPYLHLCSNPTTVRIGGVRLAAGSVDAMMLLGQQELARTPVAAPDAPKPDRLARLASHLVQQRHLLPLFPAPSDERNPLPVDVVANVKAGGLAALPDVLLTPSDLAPFAKLGHGGVLAVNPGRLTRKAAGGNYATICLHPPPPEEEAAPAPEAAADAAGADDAPPPAAAASEALSEVEKAALALGDAAGSAAAAPSGGSEEAAAGAAGGASSAPLMPAPADAPRGLDTRAFVEIKRI